MIQDGSSLIALVEINPDSHGKMYLMIFIDKYLKAIFDHSIFKICKRNKFFLFYHIKEGILLSLDL
jgi:hypothetical protein